MENQNMKKKGLEMSFNTIVIAALALVILLVLIAIFTGFAGDYAKKYKTIGDQSIKQAESKTCSGFFAPGRYCSTTSSCNDKDRSLGTGFEDCGGGTGTCCEKA